MKRFELIMIYTRRSSVGRLALTLLFALLSLIGLGWNAAAEARTAADGEYVLYLPMMQQQVSGSQAPTPTPTQPPTTPTPPPTPTSGDVGGLFLTRSPQTVSADIAVDAAGGVHVAYAGYVGYGTLSPGYYGYCGQPAACANPANWQIVSFGSGRDYVVKVELELTAAGQPRLLLYNDDNGRIYTYAACDANCGNPANWGTVDVTRVQSHVDLDTFEYSYHSFELDPQGRPRFIYEDHYGSIHNGLYYVFCDADCTDGQNWYELNISAGPEYDGDLVQSPDLKFTAQGQPRIITQLYSNNENYPEGVYYITCDAGCEDLGQWQRTRILDRGHGHASWTLALDASDRPRVAFYQAETDDGGNLLHYVWCDANCTSAANWGMAPLGLAQGDGQDPAIVLDKQGRPRIAYTKETLGGIGYLWCDSQCESGAAQWQDRLAEPMDDLNADYPVPPSFDCTLATWSGIRPALALDPAGNPRIGYESEQIVGGQCAAKINYRAVRFVFFRQVAAW